MIEITAAQFVQNTAYVQNLADKEPVLVADGNKRQVLMSYDEYQKQTGKNAEKPFVSLYDMFAQIALEFSDEEREILANIDDEADFSFAHKEQ